MSTGDTETEKRDQIKQAALALIFHYGYKKTTIHDIAKKADISVGSIYNFFSGKEDIMVACIKGFKRELVEEMRAIAESKRKPELKLRDMMLLRGLSCHDRLTDSAHGIEIVTSLCHRGEELERAFEKMEIDLVADVIAEGLLSGRFSLRDPKVKDPKEIAVTFLAAFCGFTPPECISMNPIELKKNIIKMVNMLLLALITNRSDVS